MTAVMGNHRHEEVSIQAVITRADGTIEDLGTVAYWHKNPFIRNYRNLARWLHTGRRGRITQH